MKIDVFNKYVDLITKRFGITQEQLFSKSKRRDIVDARQMLYYMCLRRNMNVCYIQEYMCKNGYNIGHSTIVYGINQVKFRIDQDNDYEPIVKSLEREVTI